MKFTIIQLSLILLAISQSVAIGQTPAAAVVPNSHPDEAKIEGRYSGTWVTTKNKKLDGTANCEVKELSQDQWQGHFWGVWQHVPFDYTVEFSRDKVKKNGTETSPERSGQNVHSIDNTAENPVTGQATIDGAHYEWTGDLTANEFKIRFEGSRYEGHLELKREREKKPTP